jgi:DNA-binding transcriptional MerR regulator
MAQVTPVAREITVGQLAARSGVTVSVLHFYRLHRLRLPVAD